MVVSIGTTHPLSLAGVGRDARVAHEYGVAHATAIAAISAQNERGVFDLFVLPPDVLRAQLDAIDITRAGAIRVGALGSIRNADVAAAALLHATAPIVFDPVMSASAGGSLYEGDALRAVRTFLSRVPVILTPNLDEAQTLTGMQIGSVDDMAAVGKEFVERGARAALVKGGHLSGDPVDVLVSTDGVETFADTRLAQRMRGTGCTLAMALACELALGRDLVAAVKGARACVRANIARS